MYPPLIVLPGEPKPPTLWDFVVMFTVAVSLGLLTSWALR